MTEEKEGQNEPRPAAPPPEPVDRIDGVPDRTARAVWWKYAIIAAIFAAWVACLICIKVYGSLDK